MNPFDMLSRNLPRPVDAQSTRDPVIASEGATGRTAPSDAASFSSLLEGLSDHPQRSAPESGSGDEAHPSDLTGQAGVGEASIAELASSVLTLLQGMLPSAGSQRGATNLDTKGQGNAASSVPLMTQDLQALGEGDTPNLTTSSKLTVAVRHQETHFRPVLENLETALQQADPAEGGALLEEQLGNELLRKSTMPAGPERQGIHQDVRSPAQPVTINPVPPEHEMQGEGASSESAPHQMVRRSSDALELRKEVSATTLKSGEPTGLPAETLHGVASAIRSDLKAASGSVAPQIVQGNEAVRTVSIKASESALRVLHLQLHPADLGSVTIRMRLAGDSLEMELHVEREDTAQLLRHDSEKLSALLRGSGYRPDVISVHVIDGPIQDRMAARPQTDMQMQGQSFPHGGAGQEGRSREQENQYGRTRAEYHQDVEIDQVPDSHSSGGVYL